MSSYLYDFRLARCRRSCQRPGFQGLVHHHRGTYLADYFVNVRLGPSALRKTWRKEAIREGFELGGLPALSLADEYTCPISATDLRAYSYHNEAHAVLGVPDVRL